MITMAIKVTVKEAQGWFKGERKQLVFPVTDSTGAPLDARDWDLQWALMTRPTATTYLLTKESGGAEITVEDDPASPGAWNRIVVTINENDLDLVRAGVELYQELKRTDDPNVLAYGPVTLMPSGLV